MPDLRCPNCRRDDQVQRLRSVVEGESGHGKGFGFAMGYSYRSDLGNRLSNRLSAFNLAPSKNGRFRGYAGDWLGWATFIFITASFLFGFGLWFSLGESGGRDTVTMALLGAALYLISIPFFRAWWKRRPEELERHEAAMKAFRSRGDLYYCRRCDIEFAARNS